MFKVNRNEEGQIRSIQTAESVFSYSYLVNPRPESDFKAGTYGTDLIIRDADTIAAIKEYISQVMREAKESSWDGKIPKNLSLPIRVGDDSIPLEAGALVLKTSTKIQPRVFIRDKSTGKPHEVTEEEIENGEIYSGMLGEIIFSFRPYNYNGVKGITAYVNAACKTGIGTPLGTKYDYEKEFSDDPEETEDEEVDEALASFSIRPKTTVKKSTKKVVVEEDELSEDDEEESAKPVITKRKSSAITKEKESANLTIDDFLK